MAEVFMGVDIGYYLCSNSQWQMETRTNVPTNTLHGINVDCWLDMGCNVFFKFTLLQRTKSQCQKLTSVKRKVLDIK